MSSSIKQNIMPLPTLMTPDPYGYIDYPIMESPPTEKPGYYGIVSQPIVKSPPEEQPGYYYTVNQLIMKSPPEERLGYYYTGDLPAIESPKIELSPAFCAVEGCSMCTHAHDTRRIYLCVKHRRELNRGVKEACSWHVPGFTTEGATPVDGFMPPIESASVLPPHSGMNFVFGAGNQNNNDDDGEAEPEHDEKSSDDKSSDDNSGAQKPNDDEPSDDGSNDDDPSDEDPSDDASSGGSSSAGTFSGAETEFDELFGYPLARCGVTQPLPLSESAFSSPSPTRPPRCNGSSCVHMPAWNNLFDSKLVAQTQGVGAHIYRPKFLMFNAVRTKGSRFFPRPGCSNPSQSSPGESPSPSGHSSPSGSTLTSIWNLTEIPGLRLHDLPSAGW